MHWGFVIFDSTKDWARLSWPTVVHALYSQSPEGWGGERGREMILIVMGRLCVSVDGSTRVGSMRPPQNKKA